MCISFLIAVMTEERGVDLLIEFSELFDVILHRFVSLFFRLSYIFVWFVSEEVHAISHFAYRM